MEAHGSVNALQCVDPDEYGSDVWSADEDMPKVQVDDSQMRARKATLPKGPPGKRSEKIGCVIGKGKCSGVI